MGAANYLFLLRSNRGFPKGMAVMLFPTVENFAMVLRNAGGS